ncbi:hypothetical protein [Paraburkholderia phenazinium]|jgi:hypothetical protein|uniref:Uncharacterized protein n=1 Tax=Paraburkholderia phenazinium TaxID=60549 RepID=A0A1G8GAY4_9BURK|nr:hypothetical protein [Paraburkholderia phenazinium]SDH91523.1 hypothetical protein SAMN05216466_114210 [Paraburkholderia phenazinium]
MIAANLLFAEAVFDHFGVGCLHTKWLNFGLLWTGTLAACGVM